MEDRLYLFLGRDRANAPERRLAASGRLQVAAARHRQAPSILKPGAF